MHYTLRKTLQKVETIIKFHVYATLKPSIEVGRFPYCHETVTVGILCPLGPVIVSVNYPSFSVYIRAQKK